MEDVISYALAVLAALVGIWGTLKGIAALTPTPKDDEFVAKAEPYVEDVIDAAERLTSTDLDGDGQVG
jgi:hypothetical protein